MKRGKQKQNLPEKYFKIVKGNGQKVGSREASASLMQDRKQVTFRPTVMMMLGAYWGLKVRWAGEGVKLHGQMVV